ncbi:Septal ring factor EnvC, activator of murein hydrolases AmiA and AmiB [Flavobacterium fontis]|jgi:septal ring factor EnvC (AmiA/AmiB activator)|uniref:Septal ring factor EnvC, activator of murein hydrolases AmiA and AmiB n=2 Tax=Flavobacterium TaxID=237 RepID=A0A1M4VYG5_9FLAO|nr:MULTISPECIES: peptidoglycan DD-metalloendopeptidase family protein [Flavobacterium]MCZ8168329.1 peptidoglycan DD-metalloendopeptidase family protein [Flavobacterium sp.]MCZ8296713.1 peptidoglycan DD-metalloendopeptidase family protein [Flavobacterium sp.]SHE73989.1 Septal ring factor EnvC, activator of murein hydrolases AmiA and AmiB [Flavobacterium fontis]
MSHKFSTLIALLCTVLATAQLTQEELEQRKAKLQQEIIEKERQLQEVRSKEKSVTKLLDIQKEKIGLKEKLINTTTKQTKILNDNIYLNQLEINRLKKELDVLKKDYAEMILKSYKSRSQHSRAMFLLSSENFTQAYKRLQYMKQYAGYRKMQGQEIKDKTDKLANHYTELNKQKEEKEVLLAEQQKQREDLEKERQEQEKLANSLKKNKKQLAAEIRKKEQESRKIDAQIQKLIREAIAEANRKAAAAKAKANPKTTTAAETKKIESSTKIVLTPEGKIISDNFKANRGSLPWPVERGVISLGFGDQPHPVYKSLVVHNSGIDITTDANANVRAVFKGEVAQIQKIGNKFAVLIKHGDYFTIYHNLSSVSVTEGENVSAKQSLGRVKTDADGKAVLRFMISQNASYVNPSPWLKR